MCMFVCVFAVVVVWAVLSLPPTSLLGSQKHSCRIVSNRGSLRGEVVEAGNPTDTSPPLSGTMEDAAFSEAKERALEYETYEDYLNSQITERDVYYLEVSCRLISGQHRGSAAIPTLIL